MLSLRQKIDVAILSKYHGETQKISEKLKKVA
jgi:hypothetical protein